LAKDLGKNLGVRIRDPAQKATVGKLD